MKWPEEMLRYEFEKSLIVNIKYCCILFSGLRGGLRFFFLLPSLFYDIFFSATTKQQQQVKFWLFNNCRRVEHEIIIVRRVRGYLFAFRHTKCFSWIFQHHKRVGRGTIWEHCSTKGAKIFHKSKNSIPSQEDLEKNCKASAEIH